MKKVFFLNFTLTFSFLLSSFAPIAAAQPPRPTMRQRIAGMRPSLPSWAKGPGFEAAKKWWKAGRKLSALNEEEKKVFNRLKKKVAIGAIIAAVAAVLGGGVYRLSQPTQAEREMGIGGTRPEVRQRQQAREQAEQKEEGLVNLLLNAARSGDQAKMKQLLQAGADGNQALRKAVRWSNKNAVEQLLQARADVDAVDQFGATALMIAASRGDNGVAEQLLQAEADKNKRNKLGRTAEEVARIFKKDETADLIRDWSPSPTVKSAGKK